MRITSKGQVTIPVGIREKMGLLPGTEVGFQISGDTVCLKKVNSRRRSRSLIAQMRGKATVITRKSQVVSRKE
jgi:AbrB family looped-hinge helix DNA binding protein